MALAPSFDLSGVPSSSSMMRSISPWCDGSSPFRAGAIVSLTLATAFSTPLPPIALLVAVAQLQGLVLAGGGAGRHRSLDGDAVIQGKHDPDGGVATGIQDFHGVDGGNARFHGFSPIVKPIRKPKPPARRPVPAGKGGPEGDCGTGDDGLLPAPAG